MRTRDVLRWNFAPWDLLLVAGIALAGFALGVVDAAAEALERRVDGWAHSIERATYTAEGAGPPETVAETGAGESRVPRGFGDRIAHGWRLHR